MCIRDEHRLDQSTVIQSDQKLLSAIRGALSLLYGGCAHDEALFQLLSETERQVGHLSEVDDTSSVDPPAYLAGVERLNTELPDGHFEFSWFQLGYVNGVTSSCLVQDVTQHAEDRHVSTWSAVLVNSSQRMRRLNSRHHRDTIARLGRSRNPFLYNSLRVLPRLWVPGVATVFSQT